MRSARLDEVFENIAANVRRRREEIGITQAELAEGAGIDTTYLQRLERGTVNVSVAVLVHVADALQTSPAGLFRPARMAVRKPGRPKATITRRAPRPKIS